MMHKLKYCSFHAKCYVLYSCLLERFSLYFSLRYTISMIKLHKLLLLFLSSWIYLTTYYYMMREKLNNNKKHKRMLTTAFWRENFSQQVIKLFSPVYYSHVKPSKGKVHSRPLLEKSKNMQMKNLYECRWERKITSWKQDHDKKLNVSCLTPPPFILRWDYL